MRTQNEFEMLLIYFTSHLIFYAAKSILSMKCGENFAFKTSDIMSSTVDIWNLLLFVLGWLSMNEGINLVIYYLLFINSSFFINSLFPNSWIICFNSSLMANGTCLFCWIVDFILLSTSKEFFFQFCVFPRKSRYIIL